MRKKQENKIEIQEKQDYELEYASLFLDIFTRNKRRHMIGNNISKLNDKDYIFSFLDKLEVTYERVSQQFSGSTPFSNDTLDKLYDIFDDVTSEEIGELKFLARLTKADSIVIQRVKKMERLIEDLGSLRYEYKDKTINIPARFNKLLMEFFANNHKVEQKTIEAIMRGAISAEKSGGEENEEDTG